MVTYYIIGYIYGRTKSIDLLDFKLYIIKSIKVIDILYFRSIYIKQRKSDLKKSNKNKDIRNNVIKIFDSINWKFKIDNMIHWISHKIKKRKARKIILDVFILEKIISDSLIYGDMRRFLPILDNYIIRFIKTYCSESQEAIYIKSYNSLNRPKEDYTEIDIKRMEDFITGVVNIINQVTAIYLTSNKIDESIIEELSKEIKQKRIKEEGGGDD